MFASIRGRTKIAPGGSGGTTNPAEVRAGWPQGWRITSGRAKSAGLLDWGTILGIMPIWVGLLIVVLAVASGPIEVRLWRAGRLSDRAVTLLLLGRFPVLVTIGVIAGSASLPFNLSLVALSLLPTMLF
ncbi:MAG: hypothetical protein H0U58_05035 [Chloroflexi bacterium]|nr:hypothetical protein [Chloroflexota bacterium]